MMVAVSKVCPAERMSFDHSASRKHDDGDLNSPVFYWNEAMFFTGWTRVGGQETIDKLKNIYSEENKLNWVEEKFFPHENGKAEE